MLHRFLCLLALGFLAAVVPGEAQTAQTPQNGETPSTSQTNQAAPAPGATATPLATAARIKGKIQVARVIGHVEAVPTAGGAAKVLRDGDMISDETTVVTSANSSVILAFSNGATVNIAANSSLDIQQFEQDPFAADIKVSDLKQEQGTSTTRLNLNHGELVGKVVHLNVDKGSEFSVQTPVGAAGIRGTTFRIIFRPNGNGTATFAVETQEGRIVFSGTANSVNVPAGRAITATFSFTPANGTTPAVIGTPIIQSQDLTPEEEQQILSASQQISAATIDLVFSVNGNPVNNTPPPPPTVPAPATTPGAGRS